MLWIHNPLSILKEKRYEIPKNSAKLFENADLLLILARYVDDDDFLDFLAVNKSTWNLSKKFLAVQNRLLRIKLQRLTESYEKIKANPEATGRKKRRKLRNPENFAQFSRNFNFSAMYFNPFYALLAKKQAISTKTQPKALKNTGNREEVQENTQFPLKSAKNSALEEDMNALEERLYQEKFSNREKTEKIDKFPEDFARFPQKVKENPEFPAIHSIKFHNLDEYFAKKPLNQDKFRLYRTKLHDFLDESLEEMRNQKELLKIGIFENKLLVEPLKKAVEEFKAVIFRRNRDDSQDIGK